MLKNQSFSRFVVILSEEELKEVIDLINAFDMEYYYTARKKRFSDPMAPDNPYSKPLQSQMNFQDIEFHYCFENEKQLIWRCSSFIEQKIGDNPFLLDSDSSLNQVRFLAKLKQNAESREFQFASIEKLAYQKLRSEGNCKKFLSDRLVVNFDTDFLYIGDFFGILIQSLNNIKRHSEMLQIKDQMRRKKKQGPP